MQPLEEVLRELGLERDLTRPGLAGRLDGRPVSIYQGRNGPVVTAQIVPALDLGLDVLPQGTWQDLAQELGGLSDVQTGDSQFDALFEVNADEPARAAALFDAELRALVVHLLTRLLTLRIGDGSVSLVSASMDAGASGLLWTVPSAVRLARALDERRADLPEATPLQQHRLAFRSFANARQLWRHDNPLRMGGRLGDATLEVVTRRKARLSHELKVRLKLDVPLGIPLKLERARIGSWLSAALSSDVPLGDAEFDRTFRLQSPAPRERLVRVVDREVRAKLLRVASAAGSFVIDHEGATLQAPCRPDRPEAVPILIETLVEAYDRMRWMLDNPTAPTTGPYR